MTELKIRSWLEKMALSIESNEEPSSAYYNAFIQEPMLALAIIQIIAELEEQAMDQSHGFYSACIFALDACVAQIQSAVENGNKQAEKNMNLLMSLLAQHMEQKKTKFVILASYLKCFL